MDNTPKTTQNDVDLTKANEPQIDINKSVLPGHDMVVNHIDGSKELAQGHVAAGIVDAETKDPTKVVSVSDFQAGPADENPRTPDPEVNGPGNQVEGKTADEVVADSQPDVNPNEPTLAFPTPKDGEAPVEVNAPKKTDAVKNSEVVSEASDQAQSKVGDAKEEAGKAPAQA